MKALVKQNNNDKKKLFRESHGITSYYSTLFWRKNKTFAVHLNEDYYICQHFHSFRLSLM